MKLTGIRRIALCALSLVCASAIAESEKETGPVSNSRADSVLLERNYEPDFVRPAALEKIQQVEKSDLGQSLTKEATEFRFKIVRRTAYSWGFQSGIEWRYNQIKSVLDKASIHLDKTYDFSQFLVDGKILCPVIERTERNFEKLSDRETREVTLSWTLAKPARLVNSLPTWREHLDRHISKPQAPHNSLFPKTVAEGLVWEPAIDKGWLDGVQRAAIMFDRDVSILQADIEGMHRFRTLYAMGIVTMPKLRESHYSIKKAGKTLHIDDVVYSLTTEADFTDSDLWNAYITSQANSSGIGGI